MIARIFGCPSAPCGHRRPCAAGVTAGRLKVEDGFTLIELLVAATLALVVVGGPLTFMIVSTRRANEASSRAVSARTVQVVAERLIRDLRQAMAQDPNGAQLQVNVSRSGAPAVSTISFSLPTPGNDASPQPVIWSCTDGLGSCTRKIGSGSAAVSELTNVISTTFAPLDASGAAMSLPATNPSYIGITLSLQATSQLDTGQSRSTPGISKAIVVSTGTDIRGFA